MKTHLKILTMQWIKNYPFRKDFCRKRQRQKQRMKKTQHVLYFRKAEDANISNMTFSQRNFHDFFTKFSRNFSKMFRKFSRNFSKIFPKYSRNFPKIFPKFSRNFPERGSGSWTADNLGEGGQNKQKKN